MHRSSAFPAISALATALLNPFCLSAHQQSKPAHEAKQRAEQAVSEDRGYRAANKTVPAHDSLARLRHGPAACRVHPYSPKFHTGHRSLWST